MKKTVKIVAVLMIASLCVSSVFAKSKKTKKAKETQKVEAPKEVKADMLDGFEDGMYWRAVGSSWSDGDISSEVELSSDWKTEGSNSLKCSFEQTPEAGGHATFITEAPAIVDVSPYEAWLTDIYNPLDVPIQVSFSLSTGASWEWHESKCFDVPPGVTKDLKMEFFVNALKCASSNWEFTANLADSDDVRRVAVKVIIPGNKEGCIYIDNLRLQ